MLKTNFDLRTSSHSHVLKAFLPHYHGIFCLRLVNVSLLTHLFQYKCNGDCNDTSAVHIIETNILKRNIDLIVKKS